MTQQDAKPQFAVCIRNDGYPASLELRKIYQVLPDSRAAECGRLRVVDESGEDDLYPEDFFITIPLPDEVADRILQAVA